ncbi:MAG: hypothetical protein ISP90_11910 [Nevskia sp.]|nr:hypothetical protein [Nevskia sp.]
MPGNGEDLRLISTRFPQIARHIAAHWGAAELGPYLKGLLNRTRDAGTPAFPEDARSALAALLARHERDMRRHQPRPSAAAPGASPAHQQSAAQLALASNEHFRIVSSRFPHIGRRLLELWDTPGCAPYLQDLLCDTRDGTRHGFPAEVGVALFQLLQVHDQLHTAAASGAGDAWSAIDGR